MISISEAPSRPAALDPGFVDVLRLAFDDVSEEKYTNPPGVPDISPHGSLIIIDQLIWPDLEHARAIVAFAERWHRDRALVRILVHCHAGVARSAAVAKFIAERYGVPISQENPDTSLANLRLSRLLQEAASEQYASMERGKIARIDFREVLLAP